MKNSKKLRIRLLKKKKANATRKAIFLALFLLVAGGIPLRAQDPYWMFMRKDGSTYHMLRGNATGNAQDRTNSFDLNVLWQGHSGGAFHCVGTPANYLQIQASNNSAAKVGATQYNIYIESNRIAHPNSTTSSFYLVYNGSWESHSLLYGGSSYVVCPMTWVDQWVNNTLTISGADEFNKLLTSNSYSHTNAQYEQWYSGTGHTSSGTSGDYTFYAIVDRNITETKPTLTFAYTWALFTDEACTTPYSGDEVSINASSGTVTYNKPFNDDTDLYLKLTATGNAPITDKSCTASKKITFKKVNYPSAIAANNIVFDNLPTAYYLAKESRDYADWDYQVTCTSPEFIWVKAELVNAGDPVDIINQDGGFSVKPTARGTYELKLKAYQSDKSTPIQGVECTFYVVVPQEMPHETGIAEGTVYLDDREDHRWSYYSDPNQPIRSLNPANVTIKYNGNGENTVTTSNDITPASTTFTASTGGNVKVGVASGEEQDRFVYYKTLERTDGATASSVDAATGRCAYTTIPNPFQVRPICTEGTNNTTKWRGFYKWRIKTITSGEVYTAATGGTPLTSGDWVDANQTLYFAPLTSEGMEVEFEALWARAYVVADRAYNLSSNLNSSTFAADSYERNFYVMKDNYNTNYSSSATINNTSQKKVTISTRYPDGTESITNSDYGIIKNNFTCNADTKFEYVTFNNSITINANAKNLVIGRGVTGTVNTVNGITENNNTNNPSAVTTNFMLRIESGTFNTIRFAGKHINYRGKVTAVLGNDYDRVKGNNVPKVNTEVVLADAYSYNNNLYKSTIGISTNIGAEALHCTVKSGDYDWGNYAGDYQFYISGVSSDVFSSRCLVVEGGKFADIAGGIESSSNLATIGAYSNGDKRPIMADMRFKGGTIKGALFGAAQYGGSAGDRRIVITGGDFKGWIAGGCNGTRKTGGELYGTTYIYVGGKAKVVQEEVNESYLGGLKIVSGTRQGVNGSFGGYIYGAGCGIMPDGYDETAENPTYSLLSSNTVGKVFGSRVVIADECVVGRDVYGGGNYGFVADATSTGTGLGSGNTDMKAEIYILGGTINGDVNGGSNNSIGQTVNIFIRGGKLLGRDHERPGYTVTGTNGFTIPAINDPLDGSVYGGSNTWGTIYGPAEIEMTGGLVNGSVFGAGYGEMTTMNSTTTVTIGGGKVMQSVYGGGKNGMSLGNVTVNVRGGEIMHNVFGGALGKSDQIHVGALKTVNIGAGPSDDEFDVRVSNHDCFIGGNVYGGSEHADDYYDGLIPPLPFDDDYDPTFDDATAAGISSRVNIASGYIQYHVFGSGFFGHTYGSTLLFIGKNAIENAPGTAAFNGPEGCDEPNILQIRGNVYGGADYGSFDVVTGFGEATISGYAHVFIDGLGYLTDESAIPTDNGYMNIEGSVYGCGTSCYSGKQGSRIVIRNYGHDNLNPDAESPENLDGDPTLPRYLSASRSMESIQFTDTLVIENTHLNLIGQGKINSLNTTEKYSVYNIKEVMRMVNGSSIFIDYPVTQVMKLGSYSFNDVYADRPPYASLTYSPVDYNQLGDAFTSSCGETTGKDNKIGIHRGTAVYVFTDDIGPKYHELEGFFHLMNDGTNTGYVYARPKQSVAPNNNIVSGYDNPYDGGFVAYDLAKNTFTIGNADLVETGSSDQIAYTNYAPSLKNGEEYYRVWEYRTGPHSSRNGVFDAHSNGSSGTYSVSEVVIELPPLVPGGKYRIKYDAAGLALDYGDHIQVENVGYNGNPETYENIPDTGEDKYKWMYYDADLAACVSGQIQTQANVKDGLDAIDADPNLHFGLVILPPEGGSLTGDPVLLYADAEETVLKNALWNSVESSTANPQMIFRLTYSNDLQANAALDPLSITLVQYTGDWDDEDYSNNAIIDEVEIQLSVTTSTTLGDKEFNTTAYAIMKGTGTSNDVYTAHVTFPVYDLATVDFSEWTLENVTFEANTNTEDLDVSSNFTDAWQLENGYVGQNQFGMTVTASYNMDNIFGWERSDMVIFDSKDFTSGSNVATSLGRHPATLDFALHFDGSIRATDNKRTTMGWLTFEFNVTNFKNSSKVNDQTVKVKVEIERVGRGKGWYLDGVNGNNNFSAEFPNAAKKTLEAIFSQTEYEPGDEIYIVNEVSTGDAPLTWSGYNNDMTTIYRYPGGHELSTSTNPAECYTGYPTTNPAYTGNLLRVTSDFTMQRITLDGNYGSLHYITIDEDIVRDEIEAEAPMVVVEGNHTFTMDASVLQHNYNTSTDGGAVVLESGATMNIESVVIGSTITNNYIAEGKNGGGIYLNSGANLSMERKVVVNGNKITTDPDSDPGKNSNVYLPDYTSWIVYGEHVDEATKVGITKKEFEYNGILYHYTPVVNSFYETSVNTVVSDNLFYDDIAMYEVRKYNEATTVDYPRRYGYFIGTWFSAVKEEPDGFDADDINTPEELAWAISVVNGRTEEDGGTLTDPTPGTNFTLTADIDMSDNFWVPIGDKAHAYTGTFEGNGHVVTGLRSPLDKENMGMFGKLGEDATIKNTIAKVEFRDGPVTNMGSIAGSSDGSVGHPVTITNCGTGGLLKGGDATATVGGLIGLTDEYTTIQSCFAANDITASSSTTAVGGLVGDNSANLYNSYSNVVITGAGLAGGLVGLNKSGGTVENCYTTVITNAFAYENAGTITICYAPTDVLNYIGDGIAPSLHGKYSATLGRKEQGYMYGDNAVTLEEGESSGYVHGDIIDYGGSDHIINWNGMLWSLNKWVTANPHEFSPAPTPWFRPTSMDINSDLPILAFTSDIALGTMNSDGRFLEYSNDLDALLTNFNGKTDTEEASLFLYGNADDVANVPSDNVKVFVNEDACLLQSGTDTDEFKATVGVTFDNSCRTATDYHNQTLNYDWHLMSTPLRDAPIGLSYSNYASQGYGSPVDVEGVYNSYFPDNMPKAVGAENTDWKWDFYSYHEPSYHWINMKRSKNNHYHMDEVDGEHNQIAYNENDQATTPEGSAACHFIPGKGYLMAIQQESYMNNTGTLNKGDVTIHLTAQGDHDEFGDINNKGCNLIGNPYQGYLNLDAIDGYNIFYIYDADQNMYVPYVKESSLNPWTPSQYIHPHQGFFVVTGAEEDLTFTTDMVSTTKDAGSYLREERPSYPLVNLFAENATGQRDMTVIEFNRPELGGAHKVNVLRNATFKVAAHLDNQSYSVLFTPEGTERVPVHFHTYEDGVFTLRWDTQNGDFTSLRLVDNVTGVNYDMLANDSYTFESTTEDYPSRFYITYACTDIDEQLGESGNSFCFYDGSEWVVNGKGQLDVIDVTGRVLRSERLSNDQNRVNLNGYAKGMYMMRLVDGKQVRVQKIVVY